VSNAEPVGAPLARMMPALASYRHRPARTELRPRGVP